MPLWVLFINTDAQLSCVPSPPRIAFLITQAWGQRMHEGDGGRYQALPPLLQVGQAVEQQEQWKKGSLPATPDGAALHCWVVRLRFS